MKNILVLKAGHTQPELARCAGDDDSWLLETLGRVGHRFHVTSVHRGARRPPRARAFDAVLMTGSPLSVIQRAP